MKRENLVGQRFGRLVVLEQSPGNGRRRIWKCSCDCGTIAVYCDTTGLTSGHKKSCGCLRVEAAHKASPTKDLSGMSFGRLTVVGRAPSVQYKDKLHTAWYCRCACGNDRYKVITSGKLLSGATLSCGCLWREAITKHNPPQEREFRTWRAMIKRCRAQEGSDYYKHYGAFGVKVCERWATSFQDFYNDVGPKPSKKHSLDRWPDPYGDYEPGNVRWATWSEQNVNRRNKARVALRRLVDLLIFRDRNKSNDTPSIIETEEMKEALEVLGVKMRGNDRSG